MASTPPSRTERPNVELGQREPVVSHEVVTAQDRSAFHGGLAGIAFLVLVLAGYSIFAAELPEVGASAEEWAAFYVDNNGQIVLGVSIAAVAMGFYLWFLASLRRMLATAEGRSGVATTVAFAGGLISFVYVIVAQSGIRAAALRAGDVDPTVTQALSDLHIVVVGPTAGGFVALYAASAYVGYRYKVIATPLVGLLAFAALSQLAALTTAFAESGAWSAEGLLGWLEWGAILGDIALIAALMRFDARRTIARRGRG